MRSYLVVALFFSCLIAVRAQTVTTAENIILITLDGMRWQEVFGGIDTALVADKRFNQGDSAKMMQTYWAPTPQKRREKLMPFLWDIIEKKGRIYGNRQLGSQVNNANPYWFSYPGYSEILCGFVDTAINTNSHPPNPNINVLEYINVKPDFQGKVGVQQFRISSLEKRL